jgi:hypothetical protein
MQKFEKTSSGESWDLLVQNLNTHKVSDSIRMNNKGLHKDDGLIRVKRAGNGDNRGQSGGGGKVLCAAIQILCVWSVGVCAEISTR